jgi:hypothetical protein
VCVGVWVSGWVGVGGVHYQWAREGTPKPQGRIGVEENVEEHQDSNMACVAGVQDRRWIEERKMPR